MRIRQRADEGETAWVGRLEFDLIDQQDGWRFGRIELVVRREFITVWWDARTLAVLDRARFHKWLAEPRTPDYWHDDVTFYRSGNNLAFRVGIGPVHPVPQAIAEQLLAVV